MRTGFTRRTFALLMLVSMLCTFVLTSCSKQGITTKSKSVMLYTDENGKNQGSLDRSFVYFWISMQKSMYESVANSYENGWEQVVDEKKGITLCDLLMTESKESAKKLLAIEYLHDIVFKISLTDEQKDSISSQIAKLTEKYGSKEKLDTALSQFGADTATLKRYFELILKQNDLYDYFYGEKGKFTIGDDAKKAYFNENYAIVTHIFFTTADTKKDDGTSVSMPEEQVKQKQDTAKKLYDAIKNGAADFDESRKTYNEDLFADKYYPAGFFVTNDSTFPAEFTTSAMKLDVGEYTYIEVPKSGIHIIKRLPMNADLFDDYPDVYKNITDTLSSDDFNTRISEYTKNVTVDENLMSQFDPMLIPVFKLS